jgi:DNA polymerase III delta prime subunit
MEDFRPSTLDEIIGQDMVVSRLRRLARGIRSGRIAPPSILMHGPPGIGKTTAARAFGRQVLGEHFANSFTELKSFDDRSVRQLATVFLKFRGAPMRGAPIRILFIDELEALTLEALNALRPAMEGEGGWTVYVLACNDLGLLSKALQSRCMLLEFVPVAPDNMRRIITMALSKTPFQLDDPVIESIVQRANGIPREAIKLLLEEGSAVSEEA